MSSSYIFIIIIGASIVTYVPRLLPFLVLRHFRIQGFWKRFLSLLPVTALGALLVPGVFSAIPDEPMAAVAGVMAAGIVSWFRGGLIFPVLTALAVSYLFLMVV